MKKIITGTALFLIIIHIIWPSIAIDSITLGLLVIAIVPWLAPLFKSLELPGGVKIEYQDLEKAGKQIEDAGLITKSEKRPSKKYDFVPSVYEDPNLVLAWLRIEIEKRLRNLAAKNNLRGDSSMRKTMISLYENKIISNEERSALADLTGTLNGAIHGIPVAPSAVEWAVEIGPRLLKGLDKKLGD